MADREVRCSPGIPALSSDFVQLDLMPLSQGYQSATQVDVDSEYPMNYINRKEKMLLESQILNHLLT